MLIGVPKEIKNNENRVAVTPQDVVSFLKKNHQVIVEKGAGLGAGFSDEEYLKNGASISADKSAVWAAEMVMKVKEPLEAEYQYFREGQILFTFLHLAPEKKLTDALLASGVTAIAYESIQLADASLPLLTPMSEVAGRMATQIGAQFLQKEVGGKGVLLASVPGVERGKVAIIGGGTAGTNAAKMAIGLGARVTILDVNTKRLAQLDDLFGDRIQTLMSTPFNIEKVVKEADLVIGAVLIPGHKAPTLVSEQMIAQMSPGSVIVDIAIDQGGIFETTDRVTTLADPTYVKHGVVHYAVANMPGAVPRTSTMALTNCTIAYALRIANGGMERVIAEDAIIAKGINTYKGNLTIKEVADDQQRTYVNVYDLVS
ncbi:alanine dehydrogenase [Vagococcus sp. BWB3-3]|uniref:Alanine dehydrogenase n=1 Tax=Vagococcus allomyrinae TaxID=2794353 RepID=A0A940P7R4_9ENTE|nr:alanine dehydrogenase [Vagococcus allomyrinae]MBP1039497.1 alanine dehydrogenase [Vagococcus allomyrinae]